MYVHCVGLHYLCFVLSCVLRFSFSFGLRTLSVVSASFCFASLCFALLCFALLSAISFKNDAEFFGELISAYSLYHLLVAEYVCHVSSLWSSLIFFYFRKTFSSYIISHQQQYTLSTQTQIWGQHHVLLYLRFLRLQ
jgi:hypothetical protein